jgi:hypothetical protein
MALIADRNTPRLLGEIRLQPAAAGANIFAGAILMRNAAGYLTQGATATGAVGVGRADGRTNIAAGAAGDLLAPFRIGTFRYENLPGDAVDQGDIGKLCYIVDDQTVAASDGTGTRSPAGIVDAVDDHGVWVRFDEALTRAYP